MIRVSVFKGKKPGEIGAAKINEMDASKALDDELVWRLMPETSVVHEIGLCSILIEYRFPKNAESSDFVLFESPDSDEEEIAPLLVVAYWYKAAMGQK